MKKVNLWTVAATLVAIVVINRFDDDILNGNKFF